MVSWSEVLVTWQSFLSFPTSIRIISTTKLLAEILTYKMTGWSFLCAVHFNRRAYPPRDARGFHLENVDLPEDFKRIIFHKNHKNRKQIRIIVNNEYCTLSYENQWIFRCSYYFTDLSLDVINCSDLKNRVL